MTQKPQRGWLFSFIVLGLIWGSSFLFMKQSLHILTPFGIAFWRNFLGALVLIVIALAQRKTLPKTAKQWLLIWVAGLLMSGIPSALFGFAQQHVSSALAAIMNASTPLFTVLAILIAFRDEKPKPSVLIGLVVGLLGASIVLGVWSGFGQSDPLALAAIILALTCYGFGTPFIRKFVSPMGLSAESAVFVQVFTSAITLAPFYLAPLFTGTGNLFVGPLALTPVASISALGIFGTGLAYVMYFDIIAKVGSAVASSVTYITPLVGVLLGALLLGEPLNWNQAIGGLVVLLGAAITQNRIRIPGLS